MGVLWWSHHTTCFLILSLCVFISVSVPSISEVSVLKIREHDSYLLLNTIQFSEKTAVRTTSNEWLCSDPILRFPGSHQFVNESLSYFSVSTQPCIKLFFCVKNGSDVFWTHQGSHIFIPSGSSSCRSKLLPQDASEAENANLTYSAKDEVQMSFVLKHKPDIIASMSKGENPAKHLRVRRQEHGLSGLALMHGMRVEASGSSFGEDGIIVLPAHETVRMRLFGEGLTNRILLTYTSIKDDLGSTCEFPSTNIFSAIGETVSNHSIVVEMKVPTINTIGDVYYLCLKDGNGTGRVWRHQGEDPWLQFRVSEKLIPLWASIIFIILLLCFSALFSGLTLGLMSLDKTDLKILCNTGGELERQYAAAIMPVRSHGSLLLCSLLLGNVLVNSVLTILMDDLTSGLVAVIFSTLTIVIFGEIMPQAICSRHGLAVGAKTIFITKFVILLTAVVAWPISKVLDFMLGEEIGNVYNRERLNELVKTGTDIEKDEVNIISGALQLSKKTVSTVMTKLEDVYMLSYDTILDFESVSDIMNSGYSRIPVFEGRRSNIITLLFIKDLAFVDPDDNTPLKTLCEFYQNSCYFVFEDMTLDILFKKFKEGTFGHMAFVQRVNAEGEGDPFYETLGLITLEDVIEELIQAEIVDETDVWTDNRSKRKREKIAKNKNFAAFAEKREHHRIHVTPHLTLATFQYLSTSVEPFKPPGISETILRRLLQQDIYRQIKVKNKDRDLVYEQGKPADYYILILEGRVEVLVGKESMRFESGPFTYFGVQSLLPAPSVGGESPTGAVPASATGSLQSVNSEVARHPFVPDYTVRATTELLYVRIKRSLYLAARRATLLEQSQKGGDHFDDEVEKLLHMDDDEHSQQGSQGSPRASRGKESPLRSDVWSNVDAIPATVGNGIVSISKPSSEVSDAEERTNLLSPAVS